MELIMVMSFLGIIGIIVYKICRFCSTSIPTVKASDIKLFTDKLPEGLSYAYYLDSSGYAVNIGEGKIFVESNYKHATYERAKIRDIQWQFGGAQKTTLYGQRGVLDSLDTALDNRKSKKQAYDQGGIFITVADVDRPHWQIKFSNEVELRRSAEILQQFLEGTLQN